MKQSIPVSLITELLECLIGLKRTEEESGHGDSDRASAFNFTETEGSVGFLSDWKEEEKKKNENRHIQLNLEASFCS